MSIKANHKCIICGREYYHCNACSLHHDEWRKVACTHECYDVYLALLEHRENGDTEAFAAKVEATGIDTCRLQGGVRELYLSVRSEDEGTDEEPETPAMVSQPAPQVQRSQNTSYNGHHNHYGKHNRKK